MDIKWKPSPNKYNGRKGQIPTLIVDHITEGSYTGAVSWLTNPESKASSHYVVSKEGEITQLVDLKDGAWANGVNLSDPKSSKYYKKSTLAKVRDTKLSPNYYSISIEHEGKYHETGGKLTPKQLEATIKLHRHIIKEVERIYGYKIPIDREHIVGHNQITPENKPTCPGKGYQFDEILKALKEPEKKPTPKPIEPKPQPTGPSKWASKDWAKATEIGIVDGTRPLEPITRQEYAVAELRALEGQDQDPSKWASEDWTKAISIGLINGGNPKGLATREQVASIAIRAIEHIEDQIIEKIKNDITK